VAAAAIVVFAALAVLRATDLLTKASDLVAHAAAATRVFVPVVAAGIIILLTIAALSWWRSVKTLAKITMEIRELERPIVVPKYPPPPARARPPAAMPDASLFSVVRENDIKLMAQLLRKRLQEESPCAE